MVVSKNWILVKKFQGFPKESDFRLEEEELRPLKDGEFLIEALYYGVDPYIRMAIHRGLEPGGVIRGAQVAKITESKHSDWPVGKYVLGSHGWRTHTIVDGNDKTVTTPPNYYILPDFQGLPLSLGLGILGLPGNTSYFGFIDVLKPKAGETIVITGAAGACGSHVGQMAKIKGLRVIGVTGSDEKAEWLIKELGFDAAINYKKGDLAEELLKVEPKGFDLFFDNVGGEISSTILYQMKPFGRVSVCGAISYYNDTSMPKVTIIQSAVVRKQLTIQGFAYYQYTDRWFEGIKQNIQWLKEGKLKHEETVTEGFENLPDALVSMLQGGNKGKAVVKV